MIAIILNATVPVFGLILIGYGCGRFGILPPLATDLLNRYVVFLALPALLFQAAAESGKAEFFNSGFLVAFGGGVTITFAAGFGVSSLAGKGHKRLSDRSIEALASSYANTAFMGIPICLAALGPKSLPAAIVASLITVSAAFGVSIILIEIDRQDERHLGRAVAKVIRQLVRNPLIFAPLAGFAVAASGLDIGAPVHRLTSLLGGAASPTALVTIGLFLSERHRPHDGTAVYRIVGLKMILQPVVTAGLAFCCMRLFSVTLPRIWLQSALLLSAMPIGTGPFMLAKLYGREAAVISRAILISTILSLASISALLAWLSHP